MKCKVVLKFRRILLNKYQTKKFNYFTVFPVKQPMNTRDNFWNIYCFATNQMPDETAKDNRQTQHWLVTTWRETSRVSRIMLEK